MNPATLTRLRAFQRELEKQPSVAITSAMVTVYKDTAGTYVGLQEALASDLGAVLDEREGMVEALVLISAGGLSAKAHEQRASEALDAIKAARGER